MVVLTNYLSPGIVVNLKLYGYLFNQFDGL